jgi:hypothetical protein
MQHTTHALAALWEPWTGVLDCAVNQYWHAVYSIEINLSESVINVPVIKYLLRWKFDRMEFCHNGM